MKLKREQVLGVIRHTLTFIGGVVISKGIATDDAKVSSIAFAINNKIKRQGIKARPILNAAFEQKLPLYDKIIDDVLNKDLDIYLQQQLNQL